MNRKELLMPGIATVVVMLAGCSAASASPGGTAGNSTAGNGTAGNVAGGGGTSNAAVKLNPASGSTGSKPTWSTAAACPAGFRGSAVFREVHSDGTTTNNISPAVASVSAPFGGTLQAPISAIQSLGGIRNGGTQKLFVLCFSGPSGTGKQDRAMTLTITYSASGSTYKS